MSNEMQARKDAMADAETLRLYFADGRFLTRDLHPDGWLVFHVGISLITSDLCPTGQWLDSDGVVHEGGTLRARS